MTAIPMSEMLALVTEVEDITRRLSAIADTLNAAIAADPAPFDEGTASYPTPPRPTATF